jgi:membrane-associated protease RseP (regulator of RpoE activity)
MIGVSAPALLVVSALLQVAHESPTVLGARAVVHPVLRSRPEYSLACFQIDPATAQDHATNPSGLPTALGQAFGLQTQDPSHVNLYKYLIAHAGTESDGLGLSLEAVDAVVRRQLKIPEGQGLVITSVTPGGPAERVGLQANDILLTLDNHSLGEASDLETSLKEAGEKAIPLELVRGGKPLTIQVKPRYRVSFDPVESEKLQLYIGVRTVPVDGVLRTHLSLPEGHGLVVTSVVKESPAQKTGLREGDLLLEVGETTLTETNTLSGAVQGSEGKPLKLKLVREGQTLELAVTPEPRPESEETSSAPPTWLYQVQPAQAVGQWLHLQPNALTGDHGKFLGDMLWQRRVEAERAADEDRIKTLTSEVEALRRLVEELKETVKKK